MKFVTDRTIRFIQELNDLESLDQLRSLMESTLSDLNVRYFALFELGLEGEEMRGMNNFSPVWVQRYREQRYEYVDPVNVKLIRTKQPFHWDSLEREGYLEPKRSRNMFFEGGEFGLREGYTFPVLNTNGYTAVITYATDHMDEEPQLVPAMQLISLYFHPKYKALSGSTEVEIIPDLTIRERECLAWAAKGKTDWEISEILAISEETVRTYIQRAKQKLGVTTKMQAVVESLRHHLIYI